MSPDRLPAVVPNAVSNGEKHQPPRQQNSSFVDVDQMLSSASHARPQSSPHRNFDSDTLKRPFDLDQDHEETVVKYMRVDEYDPMSVVSSSSVAGASEF